MAAGYAEKGVGTRVQDAERKGMKRKDNRGLETLSQASVTVFWSTGFSCIRKPTIFSWTLIQALASSWELI